MSLRHWGPRTCVNNQLTVRLHLVNCDAHAPRPSCQRDLGRWSSGVCRTVVTINRKPCQLGQCSSVTRCKENKKSGTSNLTASLLKPLPARIRTVHDDVEALCTHSGNYEYVRIPQRTGESSRPVVGTQARTRRSTEYRDGALDGGQAPVATV